MPCSLNLCPRSPDLSPIEPAFGWLKAKVKRLLPSHRFASNRACRQTLLRALGMLQPHVMRGYWRFVYEVPPLLSPEEEEDVAAFFLASWL